MCILCVCVCVCVCACLCLCSCSSVHVKVGGHVKAYNQETNTRRWNKGDQCTHTRVHTHTQSRESGRNNQTRSNPNVSHTFEKESKMALTVRTISAHFEQRSELPRTVGSPSITEAQEVHLQQKRVIQPITTDTHTNTHTHKHTHTKPDTHTRTHSLMHTHTQTHTQHKYTHERTHARSTLPYRQCQSATQQNAFRSPFAAKHVRSF